MVAVLIILTLVLGACGVPPIAGEADPDAPESSASLPQSSNVDSQTNETATAGTHATSAAPESELMKENQFWEIIDRSLKASAGSIEQQAAELEDLLDTLPPTQVASFDARFVAKNFELYTWDLWGAAYVLNGGCSDDCFDYFRNWVVGQGQDYYDAVKRDPQTLNDGRLSFASESDDAESLSYAAADAYFRSSGGRDLYEDYPLNPPIVATNEPSGIRWNEEDLESLYPDLKPLP